VTVIATPLYEVVLGGPYRETILADSPVAYWRMDAASGTTEADISGSGRTATISGGVTLNQTGALALDADKAELFDGTNGTYVETNVVYDHAFGTGPLSVEYWFKFTSALAQIGVIDNKNAGSNDAGFNSAFFAGSPFFRIANGVSQESITSSHTFNDGVYHHFVGVLTRGAPDTLKIYIDGVLDTSANLGTSGRNLTQSAHKLRIGAYSVGGAPNFFVGTIDEVAIYATALTASQVLAHYNAAVWTDVTDDVVESGVSLSYGVTGSGPEDSVAGSGKCSFALRNDARTGKPLGYYSPASASVRIGWGFGIPFRVRMLYSGTYYTRFRGTLSVILPDTGAVNRRQVPVVADDIMRTLADSDVQEVAIQIGKTEAEVITNVLASLPADSQPVALDLDVGVDTFAYALANLGSSAKALSVLADSARSAFYFLASKGDGTLIGRNRHTRATLSSSFSFNGDFTDLQVPSDLSGVYNLVKVIIHPMTIDAAATTVLYALSGVVPVVPAMGTLTLWGSYNDPLNAQRLVGGTNMLTALVAYPSANYDYAGNTAADGSGSDVTGSLSVAATAFATTVKFVITNASASPIYLIAPGAGAGMPWLRIRGKGVYDRGPQQYQASSVQPYRVRPYTADLAYQSDTNVAQAAAEFLEATYNALSRQARSLTFVANESAAKMLFAMTVEPCDHITITEPVTGLSAVGSVVQSVSLTIVERFITCTLGLAPASVFSFWQWGIVGRSEWGLTTVYAF
jgi:hypothetical protein